MDIKFTIFPFRGDVDVGGWGSSFTIVCHYWKGIFQFAARFGSTATRLVSDAGANHKTTLQGCRRTVRGPGCGPPGSESLASFYDPIKKRSRSESPLKNCHKSTESELYGCVIWIRMRAYAYVCMCTRNVCGVTINRKCIKVNSMRFSWIVWV